MKIIIRQIEIRIPFLPVIRFSGKPLDSEDVNESEKKIRLKFFFKELFFN